MKIRHQFILLIAVLSAVPLIYFGGTAVYQYYSSPERVLLSELENLRVVNGMNLSSADKKMLAKIISDRPPEVDAAFILGSGRVVISTIKEFPARSIVNVKNFLPYIIESQGESFYQITTLPTESVSEPLIYIVKFPNRNFVGQRNKEAPSIKPRVAILIFVAIFEAVFIFFAIAISRGIAKSITILGNNTRLLAENDLDTPVTITKKRLLSNEITDLSQYLETLRQTLKDHQAQRDRFIMGISHDLKTPIAIIKGYTEAISDGMMQDKKKIADSLEIISLKTNQLEGMIETLINFVKLNSIDWRNALREECLYDFMERYTKSAIATGEVFNRNISSTIDIPKDVMVRMDAQLFERTLENLFSNAIRYSSDGDSINIGARMNSKGNAEVSIKDTGLGMTKEESEHIFELFYRGTSSRREEGMGIGLSVVKTIIETHGWSINVESQQGVGTEFIITIPLK